MNKYLQAKQGEFTNVQEHFKKDIGTLRTGRVNPGSLDGVRIEAYGAQTPLSGLASISVQDARSMVISPWDKSVLKDIEKGVVEAGLGFGVVNEGDKIRLTMPMMTEENRKELVKKLNEKMEDARVQVRKVRDDIKGDIEAAEKAKEISEDDRFRFIEELEIETKTQNNDIKIARDKKEADIMTI